jgi:hypothetical protein
LRFDKIGSDVTKSSALLSSLSSTPTRFRLRSWQVPAPSFGKGGKLSLSTVQFFTAPYILEFWASLDGDFFRPRPTHMPQIGPPPSQSPKKSVQNPAYTPTKASKIRHTPPVQNPAHTPSASAKSMNFPGLSRVEPVPKNP